MDHKIRGIAALALIVIVVAMAFTGCLSSNNGPGNANENNTTSANNTAGNNTGTNTGTNTTTNANVWAISNITLSGTGEKVTDKFQLESGIAIFHMINTGSSNFAVTLFNSTGGYVQLLANEIGNFDGSQLVGVSGEILGTAAGPHYLQVESDGPWNIVVEQPRYTSAPTLPQTISGHGPNVSIPFTLETGAVKFNMTHDGESNFAVTLYANNGDYVDLLANEIGRFSGEKSVTVGSGFLSASPGIHWLNIEADGNWTIIIQKI